MIKEVEDKIERKRHKAVVYHQVGDLVTAYTHRDIGAEKEVGEEKRQKPQRIHVENHQGDEYRVEHRQFRIVQSVDLGKFQMFAPDQYDEGYADQKSRQRFGKGQQIRKGIGV